MKFGTHTNGLPFVDDGSGHRRILACLPPTRFYNFRSARDVFGLIPRSEWKECSLRGLGAPILDQDGHGSCVGHGSCTAFTYNWLASGATYREFSPTSLYAQINGGSDNGAVVGDALEALQKTGICLMSSVPETIIYERQMPSGWQQEAGRFKIAQGLNCPTFDDIATQLLLGRACSFGTEIGSAFEPDSQGIIPDQRGGGGGHCMCAIGLKQINGRWYIEVQNSWGTRWGAGGYCFMPESYFQGSGDHWTVLVHQEDPQEPTEPPTPL